MRAGSFRDCVWQGMLGEGESRQLVLMPYLVVYTPPTKAYYCVEPVGHVSNAIHMSEPASHGLCALAPQATLEAWMKIEISRA